MRGLGILLASALGAAIVAPACGDDAGADGGTGGSGATAATTSSSATGSGGGDGTGGSAVDGPTFHGDVAWILHEKCLHCHTDGQIGGFSLEAYEDASPLSDIIVERTQAGEMPPFHAKETDDCEQRYPWKHDPRLDEEQLAILAAWDANGAPAGDPAEGPPPYELAQTQLEGATMTLEMQAPFTVTGDRDTFECFIFDPAVEEEVAYLDGIHFRAGNTEVAHHALTFSLSRADALEMSNGEDRFTCFGAPPGQLIHAWAPGGQPFDLPPTVGIPMTPDDVIVVQMHYNPVDDAKDDTSSLELRFTDERPAYLFQVVLPGNASSEGDGLLPGPNDRGGEAEFYIPAGVEGHTEEMIFDVDDGIPIDIPILFAAPHMHYVGTDMRFSVERADPQGDQPAEECLVRTPGWDFNWQRFYEYDAPIDELPSATGGDVLRMKCTYDNTLGNPALRRALDDEGLEQPVDVSLGEQTLDEMCIGALGILIPNL